MVKFKIPVEFSGSFLLEVEADDLSAAREKTWNLANELRVLFPPQVIESQFGVDDVGPEKDPA